ncbi:MAG: hypothetical protein LBQ61_10525 [Spirochaetales bacterium]|jgi:hypothetical protein|nr:hypothetical protein [Spirochaetales bacterium]
MKKSARFPVFFAAALSLWLAWAGGLPALEESVFLAGVNFETPLNRLCDLAEGSPEDRQALLEEDKIYLLLGAVTDRFYLETENGEFRGELILTQGEWLGQEEVKIYRAAILFEGPRFEGLIPPPGRRSRTAAARNIPLNAGVLAAAKLTGFREEQGRLIPVLKGIEIRLIS